MKVSYRWLSEYVDLTGYTARDLADKLNRSGIAVDVVENRNKGVSQVVVGFVKAKEKHPDADKLNVCTVDAGQGEDLQIVCGAPNVSAGQKVPVALVGAALPGDVKIKRAKLRGVESQGMICSAKELAMNERLLPKEIQEGILVLPEDIPVGSSILDVLTLDDEVIELELTPNRSDCLSMIGVAYEVAAILGREVKLPADDEGLDRDNSGTTAEERVRVTISAPEQCSRYAARCIEDVVIGPSPLWMQNRLMAAGIRPINNVVDITNYVMLEYGQPLHAFDADLLSGGRIDVRLARPREKIVTLDDVERELEPQMLLIADGEKPVAIAGVMGAANSEVSANTRRILLESAKFSGGSVRKTSRQLGLRSEASMRFEKEVNPEAVVSALNRAASLMARYAGGTVAKGISEASLQETKRAAIRLDLQKVNNYLGTALSLSEVQSVFDRLQFNSEPTGDGHSAMLVHVPGRRGDISREVDLIEEVARIYGYERIPTTLISGVTTPGGLNKEQQVRRTLRRLLTGSGLHEAITYSFTHPEQIRRYPGLFPHARPIALNLPMSEERSVLRTSLIPHLLETAVYNRNRNNDDVALFEIGRIFLSQEERLTELPVEKWMLGIVWTGKYRETHWSGKSAQVDFYDLKGIVENIVSYLGLPQVDFVAAEPHGLHPGRAAEIVLVASAGERIMLGRIGQLHPALQQELDLAETYLLEIALEPLANHADFAIAYRTLPRYPSVGRDLAVVVDGNVSADAILRKAKETAGDLLESIDVFDVYRGERLGADKKSVALSLVYRHAERTLTDEEVSELHNRIVSALEETFAAELRK